MTAAVSPKFLAPVTVGFAGQLIRTAVGKSSGAISSTLISSDVLIWALPSRVILLIGILPLTQVGFLGLAGVSPPVGPLVWVLLILVWSADSPQDVVNRRVTSVIDKLQNG
jgi:hypothetical protein